jgi:hypothetical protein
MNLFESTNGPPSSGTAVAAMRQRPTLVIIAMLAILAFLALPVLLMFRMANAHAAACTPTVGPPPVACVTVWPTDNPAVTTVTIGGPSFGFPPGINPNSSRADTTGLTQQVATAANPLTVVTNFENIIHVGGPCGVAFWNPITNKWRWIGFSSGFTAGLDLDRTGPTLTAPGGRTFGPGDVWTSVKTGDIPLVNIQAGSGATANVRGYFVGFSVNGVSVSQSTGNVFFTDESPGDLEMLNPATNAVSIWPLGGTPHYTSTDTSGNVYATVKGPSLLSTGDAIYKLDPSTNTLTAWPLPSPLAMHFTAGVSFSSTPDGIEFNPAAKAVWFDETAGNQYGRLDPTTNEIVEIPKSVVNTPQQIASSGSGASERAFATESEGNAVDVITPGAGVVVMPRTMTLTPLPRTPVIRDMPETYAEAIITPATTPLTGVDPAGLVHFSPMPSPAGGTGLGNDPSGMTGVVPAAPGSTGGTIFGSYLAEPSFVSQNSATFEFNSTVIPPPPPSDAAITATGVTFSATEGQPFAAQTVANFHDPDPMSTAAEYSATIDWGDSSSSPPPPVTITPTGTSSSGNDFAVKGDHTYTEEGTYTLKVTITDVDNPSNTAIASSTARVADAALHASCAAAPVSTQSFSGPTATFLDDNMFATKADFSATINWGDSTTTAGTVSGGPGVGPYTVSGSHTYSTTGTFTITTTITDDGGATATATCTVLVAAFPTATGGTFVVGDLEAAPLASLTWWGSQWAQINLMSGGPAPASMKGFAGFEDMPLPSPLPPLPKLCGMTWTTDTGNATPPPPSVPSDMFVIVSSHIMQNGSIISGDIKQLIVVHNNPGYQPDPGHPGTGTEEAIVC